MIKKSYMEILEKISNERGISIEELEKQASVKIKQLGDLISKEGAAYIIANQLGVRVFDDDFRKKWQIKDLIGGMSNISLLGKVMTVYGVHAFKNSRREGKVISFLLGDETGAMRVVVWDENYVKQLENGEIKEDYILKIKNAYTKSNNGFVELHVGGKTQIIINPEGEKIDVVGGRGIVRNFNRKLLNEVCEGEVVEVFCTIVQVFEPRSFIGCKECGKRLEDNKCIEHGDGVGVNIPILHFFIDDGTENLQANAFRDVVERLTGVNKEGLFGSAAFLEVKKKLLGKQVVFQGRVVKNNMFNRLDFMVNDFRDVDPLEEINKLF